MKISILLPYKENYCKSNAGAVSLFVKDTMNVSIFKKKTLVFGSTKFTDFLSNNYINIEVKEKIYKSSNSEYVKNFIKNKNFIGTDILEIHNRPNYVDLIRKNYKNKIFFYFHNDPLLMLGSKNLEERKELFNKVDKLIFNSLWSKTRFFIGFENDYNINSKTTICYQSTNKVKIDFKKKKKIITFIGKLNRAKGYDLFGNVVLKILDKYKDWKAYVIGNEPREQFNFVHKNLINLGFKNNNFVLNFLKFSSISVICSRWDEPFGRSSLEASSRGSATIISNKGGLPETSRAGIILKKLDEKNLYNEIEKLLKNPNKLLALQKKKL